MSRSHVQVDVAQLSRRSEGTQWDWKSVESWLDLGEGGGRALCVLAGAGTGKSTISAAILTKVMLLRDLNLQPCPQGLQLSKL